MRLVSPSITVPAFVERRWIDSLVVGRPSVVAGITVPKPSLSVDDRRDATKAGPECRRDYGPGLR